MSSSAAVILRCGRLTGGLKMLGASRQTLAAGNVICGRRSYTGLGIGGSDNDAAFPKPEFVPGIGDGIKDYGFPVRLDRAPTWWFPDDHQIYYRKPKPYWKAWPIGTIFYFFLLWNCYKNYHVIIGDKEFYIPRPDLWTDEELGIPLDDVEGYGFKS